MMKEKLFQQLDENFGKIIELYHWLHQHAELSFQEKETSRFIESFYSRFASDSSVKVQTGVGGNGVVVTIDTGRAGKTIALRADFDALPIVEETNLAYASKNQGVMHACGHDAHTAYLMVLAEILIGMKDALKGKIVIIHQPGEEVSPGGASLMIKDGVLEGVDNVFGCHVMSQLPLGQVLYHAGATQQARANFSITLQGKGGHGAAPHEANDALVAGSFLVTALQTIISRRVNPFEAGVVTIGNFDGQGTPNIIKDSVLLQGDVRCISEDVGELIEAQVHQISQGIGMAFGCEVSVDYHKDYPVLMNDNAMTALLVQALEKAAIDEVTAVVDGGQQAPSEDFSFYTKEMPCCFFYIGASKKEDNYPHHHPKFEIAEESMIIAAKSMGAVVLEYMGLL